jgi:hypothetical protein
MISQIENIVDSFIPVALDDIDKVKFMDRIDTKYVLAADRIPDLLRLMNGNYRVLEINNFRIPSYNTFYLDTPDFEFFNQHVTGRSGRIKVRFRRYESNGITFLEIKKKTIKGRTVKWRIENNFLADCFDESAVQFINKHVSFDPGLLRSVLDNSFKRITFTSFNSPERITIDLDLSYSVPGGRGKELPLIAIAELKSDGLAVRSPFSKLIKQLSVQPTGFSKYCTGIAMFYDLPRMNMLKPKILLLNRIENEYDGAISA